MPLTSAHWTDPMPAGARVSRISGLVTRDDLAEIRRRILTVGAPPTEVQVALNAGDEVIVVVETFIGTPETYTVTVAL